MICGKDIATVVSAGSDAKHDMLVNRGGHDETLVVIGMLTDQIDASGGCKSDGRFFEFLLKNRYNVFDQIQRVTQKPLKIRDFFNNKKLNWLQVTGFWLPVWRLPGKLLQPHK
jgi:hypothetical protein